MVRTCSFCGIDLDEASTKGLGEKTIAVCSEECRINQEEIIQAALWPEDGGEERVLVLPRTKTISDQFKFNQSMGHGHAAEQLNNLIDRLLGKDAVIVGDNNLKNGADRVVDGIMIQTKCCASASKTIASCFENGQLRYINTQTGKPMLIEVPFGQGTECIKLMEKRISTGQVPGVSDPSLASEIILEGQITHSQAINIAKFGKIESLLYDSAHGMVSFRNNFGLSATFAYFQARWNGEDHQSSLKKAYAIGIKSGGSAFVVHVLTAQLARTEISVLMKKGSGIISDLLGPEFHRWISSGKEITKASAVRHFERGLQSHLVSGLASMIVVSWKDLVEMAKGDMALGDGLRYISIKGCAVTGTMVTHAVATKILKPRTVLEHFITAGIGVLGGYLTEEIAKEVFLPFNKKEGEIAALLIKKYFHRLSLEYMLSKEEAFEAIKRWKKKGILFQTKEIVDSSDTEITIRDQLIPIIEEVVLQRGKVHIDDMNGFLTL